MITQEKLNFLNTLLDKELYQLSTEFSDLHQKINTLEQHYQKKIDNQPSSQQQSIIEKAFPTLGKKDSVEDLTPLKRTERKTTPVKISSPKKKRKSTDRKKSIKQNSQEKNIQKSLMIERQQCQNLQSEVKKLNKQLKKAQSTISQLKQELLEKEKFKENYQKSESIRMQQKELIACLKKEIERLKQK